MATTPNGALSNRDPGLGILFVGVTGFAPLEAIHDAAHNTRHAISFPCH